MSKIAALQFPTLALSESRLDYYLKASKDNGANLVVLGEYVINSFFTELLHMPKNMIKEQSEAKKESLIKLAKKYELEIIAPYVSVEAKSYKKLCLKVTPNGVKSYEQQILMPYEHWNEEKFFSNKTPSELKIFTFNYEKIKCALLFGFETHFDIFWQQIMAKKIDLVIVPSACTFESKQRWEELLKTRAFLNSTSILRVNRIGKTKDEWNFYGDTLFINAFGEIESKLGSEEEMLIIEPKKSDEARKLWGFDKILRILKKVNVRKILLQILIFSVLFIVAFTINRILMQNSFIPAGLISDKNEIFLMYLLGVFHDIRFLSAAFLPFLLCGFLSLIFSNIKINNKLVIYSKNFISFFQAFI